VEVGTLAVDGLAVPDATAHPSTASVPIAVLLYGFNVPIKGLITQA